MKICRGPSALESLPMDGGGSDIVDGALLTIGITDETDRSCVIISGDAAADVIGVKEGLHDFSEVGETTPEDGAAFVLGLVNLILPGALLAAEYALDTSNDIDVASATSTVITISSLEDDLDGSFMYVSSGTGAGQLVYIKQGDSGSCTVKSAMGTTLDSTPKVHKIKTLGHTLCTLTSDRAKIGQAAAVGAARLNHLVSEVKYAGSKGWERLDPTKHHNLTGLNSKNVALRSIVAPTDSWFSPLD